MSQIHIKKPHCLGMAGARKTAEKLTDSLSSEYNAKCEWERDDAVVFTSSGVKGKLQIREDELEIDVSLGLVLRPLKSKIESGIVSKLDQLLGGDENIA